MNKNSYPNSKDICFINEFSRNTKQKYSRFVRKSLIEFLNHNTSVLSIYKYLILKKNW